MNDGLPTEEQLRRIELGVQRRIDARRRLARQVAGGAVAAVLVVGGFAVLRPFAGTSGGASSASGAGSAGGSFSKDAATAAAAGRAVRCHGAVTTTVTVDPAALPASALSACAAADQKTAFSGPEAATGGRTPRPTPSGAVLCQAQDGSLSVWPGGSAVCAQHGLEPWSG